jgi:hypothetical protein
MTQTTTTSPANLLAELSRSHSFGLRITHPDQTSRDQEARSNVEREVRALGFELAAFLTRALWAKGFAVDVQPGDGGRVSVEGAGPCRLMTDGAIAAFPGGAAGLLGVVYEAARETIPDGHDFSCAVTLAGGGFRGRSFPI